MADRDTDLKKIKKLIKIMKQNGLVELEIKHGDDKISLKRSQPQPAVGGAIAAVPMVGPVVPAGSQAAGASGASSEVPAAQSAQGEEDLVEVKSPIVGTFYAKPSPDSEPYVELGSQVDAQTIVCMIEAMKVMNEIKSEHTGTIAEVLVNNGQAVEYGQVLFRIKPD